MNDLSLVFCRQSFAIPDEFAFSATYDETQRVSSLRALAADSKEMAGRCLLTFVVFY